MACTFGTATKILRAINTTFPEERILYNQNQFYSDCDKRAITIHSIKKTIVDVDSGKKTTVELFSSASQLLIVLFLRDYWFQLNGWEVPKDNPVWEQKISEYRRKRGAD